MDFSNLFNFIRYKLLYVFSLLLSISPLTAQISDSLHPQEEILLDAFTVTSQKVPISELELLCKLTIITKEEIAHCAVQDLASLLEYVGSIDVRKRGVLGMQADISIRGGSFDQTMILLNGVNISDPQTGHHNLNIPVDINSIERIEILQGAAARIFAANAFSGVINIITNEPDKTQSNLSLTAGQYGYLSASAAKGFKTLNTLHFAAVSLSRCDGFAKNTDFQLFNFYYRNLSTIKKKGKLDTQLGFNSKAFGAQSFYSPKYPEQYEETQTVFASLKLMTTSKFNITPTIYWRRHYDHFELFRNSHPSWYTKHNNHMTDILGVTLNGFYDSKLGKTSLGGDLKYENIYSDVLGNPLQTSVTFFPKVNTTYTHTYYRKSLSMMAEQTYGYKSFKLTAGALFYANSDIDKFFNVFPGIDMGVRINEYLSYFISANRTLRLPTFTDLFYVGPVNIGNPFLKPEEALGLENGFKFNKKSFHFDVCVFRRWGYNMIDWVKNTGDEKWQSMNITKLNTSGFETALVWPLHFLKGKKEKQRTELKLNYTYLHTDKYSGQLISYYVLDYLKHKISISLNHDLLKNFNTSINLTWQDRAGTYLLYENGNYSAEQDYKPFYLLDLRLLYNLKSFKFFIEGSNIINTPVVYISNVPQPGRWIRLGLVYKR